MTGLAIVDEVRALPLPIARAVLAQLEAELGPEAVAALRYDARFWARPAQLVADLDHLATIEVFVGERRAGKTWAARNLFTELVLSGRARLPRIVSATDPAIEAVVLDGSSGLRQWLPPDVNVRFMKSDGYAGTLYIDGVKIVCCSAAAPGQAIGMSRDVTLAEDPAGWVESCGAAVAGEAWTEILKSNSEGISCVIVATTRDGAEFIVDMLDEKQRADPTYIRIHDLGAVENNRGNLAPNYLKHIVSDLRTKAQWDKGSNTSPFAVPGLIEKMRLDVCPPLKKVAVAIDPSRSAGQHSCDVGIVGGGLDRHDIVHARNDQSAILDAGVSGWPSVAWDLAEELLAENPGATLHFILESNTGSNNAELLRSQERERRRARGEPGSNIVDVVLVKAKKNKCERAKLPARQAALGQVRTALGLTVLESQLRNLTPDGKKSDHADAFVHLVRDLAGLSDEKEIERMASEQEEADEAAAQCRLAAEMNAAMAARVRPGAVDPNAPIEPMKVPGALPGDPRAPAPQYPSARGGGGWRSRSVL